MLKTNERVNERKINHEKIFAKACKTAKLSPEEAGRLQSSLAAEIIITTAFVSGCRNPERVILSHLCTLVAAVRAAEVFAPQKGESISERIESLNHYPGGEPETVKAGMLLLELLSLNDHQKDLMEDLLTGKHNPLIGGLDYEEEKADILYRFQILSASVCNHFNLLFEKTVKAGVWY